MVVEGPTDLAERLLVLLDQGAVSTTYKYALLAAMIDVALRHTAADGTVDSRLPVDELADAVLDLYWPQTDPYSGLGGGILRQSGRGQAEIVTEVRQFRERDPSGRTTLAAARYAPDFPALRRQVAWKLAEMPLPRLQRVGRDTHPFLYELAWDETISRRAFDDPTFDRSITLLPGVAEGLCRLAPLVRPLLHRLWAGQVVAYNRLPDGDIDRFLFHRERVGTLQLRRGLLELQGGRCFYTGEPLSGAEADVDHFLPWSRSPMNAVENLVVAGRPANNNKRDHLAAVEHLAHWRSRNMDHAEALVQLATRHRWETAPANAVGVARALYLPLRHDHQLWLAAPDQFVNADTITAGALLAS